MKPNSHYHPEHQWLTLGEGFSDAVRPASFAKQIIRYRNQKAAKAIGLDGISDNEWTQFMAEFKPLPDNLPEPLALRYHGHQFTHYNPDLGDGRGFLYAQVRDDTSGRLLDLGTKGSGLTPYSRRGDGRLTLKGAVREALATAYLEHHKVNTSKTLSVIETGEELERNDEPSPTRSAVLVRLSHSHVRFGTFQRLAFLKDKDRMNQLTDYCLQNYYPGTKREDFFNDICRNVAQTTASWMIHGFVHGVLNTDNMNITGESFDYGPYRFLPHYDPDFTAAYFDHQSLYAYSKQPQMVFWNLERLKEALELILPDPESYNLGFKTYKTEFEKSLFSLFCKKIGIIADEKEEKTKNLFYTCLQFLEKSKAPYEAFFNDLYCWHQDFEKPLRNYNLEFYNNESIEEIQQILATFKRDPNAPIRSENEIQTLLIDEIESIWLEIDKRDDWTLFNQKIKKLNSLNPIAP